MVTTDRCCSSVGALEILFQFLTASILDFAKNILSPPEPKLLVMWEKIGEVLKMVYSTCKFGKTWY
jgi:hypothetical protein